MSDILMKARAIASDIPEAVINVISLPAIAELSLTGGLEIQLQSRADSDPVKLAAVMGEFIGRINQSPEFLYSFSSYTADTPHVFLDIDREKAKMMGIPISSIFSTLKTYFGTEYINDINIGSHVNKVMLQSDWMYRDRMESVLNIHIEAPSGARVPIETLMTLNRIIAPREISRYNLYPAAQITALMAPGVSTGQGMASVTQLADDLPDGYVAEWSGMTYQEQEATGQAVIIIMIALVFGYLFLVAQYESWTVPLGVVFSLPVALLGALLGLYVMNLALSIYAQLGILLLVGLAAKNAILIIEFAQEQHEVLGQSILDAAAKAGGERFRSVMMTALTCVIGVAPMLVAKGAGAASRLHVGATMFFGMSMATVFGIFLIPGLYVALETNRERVKRLFSRLFSKKTGDFADENGQ
jgi:multidrug efflux pump subunit AcrB